MNPQLLTQAGNDAYVIVPSPALADLARRTVATLARFGLRSVSVVAPETASERQVRSVMESCSVVVASPDRSRGADIALAAAQSLERQIVLVEAGPDGDPVVSGEVKLDAYIEDHVRSWERWALPYAFLATRIHDDFAQVRRAIAFAVERELGIPCFHFDDTRVPNDGPGVRERTRELIQGASLFIADLTFAPDNLGVDSPNTAHEHGMAVAYDVPVLITCQLPRRDFYFLAGDMRALFWRNEADLARELAARLRARRFPFARQVLSGEPLAPDAGGQAVFAFDRSRRYVAPNSRVPSAFETAACIVGLSATVALLTVGASASIGAKGQQVFAAAVAALGTAAGLAGHTRALKRWSLRWPRLSWAAAAAGAGALCWLGVLLGR